MNFLKKFISFFIFLMHILYAQNSFSHFTSMQGYSGIINIPTAEVIDEGDIEFEYWNERTWTFGKEPNGLFHQYINNIGLFSFIEIGGRLSEISQSGLYGWRDLSGNVKIQLPFYHKYLPKLAVGIQDLGGEVDVYDSKYIVASKQFDFLNATLGYSYDSLWMDGTFGGVEIKTFDWLYLLGEYDTNDYNVALRINTPKSFFKNFDSALSIKKSFKDDKNIYFALNIKFHLGQYYAQKEQRESFESLDKGDISFRSKKSDIAKVGLSTLQVTNKVKTLKQLKSKLIEEGFENIEVGSNANELFIAYENSIYNTNELDAIGVVLGYATSLQEEFDTFNLHIKKSNQFVISLQGDLEKCKQFYINSSIENKNNFVNSLKFVHSEKKDKYNLIGGSSNSGAFKTRIELSPGVKSFVGTEYGNFDYLVSLHTHFYWNLYNGLDFGVSADIPFLESDDLKRPNGHYASYNEGNQIENILLHYNNSYNGIYNITSVGQFLADYVGVMNQTLYSSGKHTFKLKYGYFQHKNETLYDGTPITKEFYLARYSYFFEEIDMFAEFQFGQYYNYDRGFDFKIKRFFGDTALLLRYQNTQTPLEDVQRDEYIQLAIELPITPRRVENYKYAQLSGKSDFYYGLRSTIRRDEGQGNVQRPKGAIEPKTDFEIENYLLNRNRLTMSYLQHHMSRLIDAYKTYALDKE